MEVRTLPGRGTLLRGLSVQYAMAVTKTVKESNGEFFSARTGTREYQITRAKESRPIVVRRWRLCYEISESIRVLPIARLA